VSDEAGRYVRESRIATGGMGEVWRARDSVLGREVAVKLLKQEYADDPTFRARFDAEARHAASLHHPGIASVFDYGVEEETRTPYLVMELVDGEPLSALLAGGRPVDPEQARRLIAQTADALGAAHAAGVIHRDVKPANLFLSRGADGTPVVKMLDFGIAKVVEETAQNNLELTKTRAVMGSALYMSLEQMRSTKTVDYRTDIYSLGITLYELLTHTHPFMAESFSELCVKVSLDPPDPINRHRPDITDELAEVIAQAYARYPDDRYPTVAAFAAALAPFAAEETQAMISAIQRIERAASGERPMVRMLTPLTNKALIELNKASTLPPPPPPPPVPWALYTSAFFFAGVAIAAIGWGISQRNENNVNDVDSGVDAGPIVINVVAPSAEPVQSAAPTPSTSLVPPVPSASSVPLITSASAGPAVKAPTAIPAQCRRGELDYLLPSGMRKLCPR
jgi:serine/threonine protein kinase